MLAGIFALSVFEKARILLHGSARWHPVLLLSGFRRRHATPLVGASGVADAGASFLLFLGPGVGAALGMVLASVYTVAAVGVHSSAEGCRCLPGPLNTRTFGGLVVRNAILGAAAVFVFVWPPGGVSLGGFLASVILLLLLGTAVWATNRYGERGRGARPRMQLPGRGRRGPVTEKQQAELLHAGVSRGRTRTGGRPPVRRPCERGAS